MANENQNPRYRGWCPSNDYQVHEVVEPALRRHPRHQKGRVAFKTNLEEPIIVAESQLTLVPKIDTPTITNYANDYKSVDEKAGAFISQEYRRIELARLKSLGKI
ncbi:hypothetical protein Fmac_013946 [Flemingia macrophylla]|uniref:Uncharacterized protein n=1 Tax=Flemingia macrophylla TaxID=520843 RepID=A0ABD1MB29_9FABA